MIAVDFQGKQLYCFSMTNMKLFTIIFTIIFIMLCGAGLNAEIYSWTDKDGVKHFSNSPPDKEDAQVEFKEYEYDQKKDKRRTEDENEELESLIKDIEHTERKEKEAAEKRAAEAKKNRPATMAERIEAEKKRLTEKIVELEEQPLEYFGSFKNKRNRIGFYKYRLQALEKNPQKYFENPVGFEGNIKYPEDSDATN